MTQESDSTSAPPQTTPGQEYLPADQRIPAPSTPADEQTPPHGFPPPSGQTTPHGFQPPGGQAAPHGFPPPGRPGPPPDSPPAGTGTPPFPVPPTWAVPGQPVHGRPATGLPAPTGGGRRSLWIAVGVLVAVVVVLAGVLTWTLVSSRPDPAPPAVAQPIEAPAGPATDSPAVASAARQQFGAAFGRFSLAGVRFGQQAQQAGTTNNRELARSAVTDFRAAAYGYDAEIRRITFPNAQQTVVNTQLLPATGRLVGDLDQLGNLDPASMQSAGDRMVGDDRTTVQLSRQVLSDLGGI